VDIPRRYALAQKADLRTLSWKARKLARELSEAEVIELLERCH